MGLPIAMERDAALNRAGLGLHRTLADDDHVDSLAQRLALHIESLAPQGRVRCLDVGGGDMSLAAAVHERVARTDWHAIDVRAFALRNQHEVFAGAALPHADAKFDVAVLCDVLRHERKEAAHLLAEAGRVARYVLIKDRFADGPGPRSALRIMNLVGHLGGRIPKRHFTREEFVQLAAEQRLFITALDCELTQYDHLPALRAALNPPRQFIAVLCRPS